MSTKTEQGTKKIRVRKSVALTPDEHVAFKAWVDGQPTKIDAAEKVKVSRGSLDDLYIKGSGKPENIKRIQKLIKPKLSKAA